MKTWFILFILLICPIYAQFDVEQFSAEAEAVRSQFGTTGMAIIVVHNDSVIYTGAFGLRDAEKRLPVTTRSLFNIASCTKAFTAAALAILESEDKISWQDKVVEYIPGFKLADPYITTELNLEDILTHRSGLGTFYGDLLWYGTDYTPAEIIQRMRYLPITEDFRSTYGYQNNMYLIAGEIIKKVSGIPWSQYIQDHFFTPLQMTNAKTCSEDLTAKMDIAYPHLEGMKQELYIDDPHAAYSLYANVEDLTHWVQMWLRMGQWKGKEILSEQTVQKILDPHMTLRVSRFMRDNGTHFRAYGLGWFLFDYAGRKIVEHDGGMPGYISKITLVPEENLAFVILTNDLTSQPSAIRYILLDTIFNLPRKSWYEIYMNYNKTSDEQREKKRQKRYEERRKNTRPSLPLSAYVGRYEDIMYGPAEIAQKGKDLSVTLLPTKRWFVSAMEHWHFDTFRIKFLDDFLPEGFVTFHFDTDRNITGFTIDLPNPDFHFFNLNFKKIITSESEHELR